MKSLFFIAVTSGIFLTFATSAKAQTGTGAIKASGQIKAKPSLKFIESIEINPGATTKMVAMPDNITTANSCKTDQPAITRTDFSGDIEHFSTLQFKYAMMMDTEVENITNLKLYGFINIWWAKPYKFGGNDTDGIDCSAFTGKLLSAVYALTLPRTVKDQYKLCEELAITELTEGDLVFFNIGGGVNHVGLYLGNNHFVHSSVHDGVTISSLNDQYYSSKFVAGGRIAKAPATSVYEDPATRR